MKQAEGERPGTRAASEGGSASTRTFEDPVVLRARLADYLSAQTGATVTVESLVKFPAGFSWITYGVRLAGFAQAQNVILRIGPPYGLFAPYSAMPEFESLSALQSTAVPIPQAFLASDDASILGAPFFICALAALHTFDWRPTRLAKWGNRVSPENAALHQLEFWQERFERWALRP